MKKSINNGGHSNGHFQTMNDLLFDTEREKKTNGFTNNTKNN